MKSVYTETLINTQPIMTSKQQTASTEVLTDETKNPRATLFELANKYHKPAPVDTNARRPWLHPTRKNQISNAEHIIASLSLQQMLNIDSEIKKKSELSWGEKIVKEAVLRCIRNRKKDDVNNKIILIASKSILEILTIHSEIKNKNHFAMLDYKSERDKLSWEEESTAIAVRQIMEPIQSQIDKIAGYAWSKSQKRPPGVAF